MLTDKVYLLNGKFNYAYVNEQSMSMNAFKLQFEMSLVNQIPVATVLGRYSIYMGARREREA